MIHRVILGLLLGIVAIFVVNLILQTLLGIATLIAGTLALAVGVGVAIVVAVGNKKQSGPKNDG